MSEYSDAEIIELFKDPLKRESAFKLLVVKYQERLYWHCRRLVIGHEDADDALQNTFVKAWKNLKNFRNESGLFTWLYRIATNESLSLLRSNKKHSFNISRDENMKGSSYDKIETDPYFDGDETQIKLQKAIFTLPEKQRIVFNMKYYEEIKYQEMAKILKTSVGALKASYHHAVKKIEKYILSE